MLVYRFIWLVTVLLTLGLLPLEAQEQAKPPFIYGGLAWSPDGKLIAVGTSDGIWLHDATDLTPVRQLTSVRFVVSLAWNPIGNTIASDGVNIWDVETGELLKRLVDDSKVKATSAAWSPDGSRLAAGLTDNSLRVWDGETGDEVFKVVADTALDWARIITWSADGRFIAARRQLSIGGEIQIVLWDLDSGQAHRAWKYELSITSLKWSPDGKLLATTTWLSDDTRIWNVGTGETIAQIPHERTGHVTSAWSPDSQRLAIAVINDDKNRDGWIEIWDINSMVLEKKLAPVIFFGDGHYDNAVAYSSDGSRLASISDDGKVFIWETETYEKVAEYDGYRAIWDIE